MSSTLPPRVLQGVAVSGEGINTVRVSPVQVFGGVFHWDGPPAGSGNGTRSENSVRERGHRICTSIQQGNRETGFYSRYFIVPKKDGGCVPFLDLRVLNDSVIQLKAQVQNVNFETDRASDQIRGLVCHDRAQECILPHIHPSLFRRFLRFAFGGKAYQYRVLPFGLALSPRTFTKYVDAALVPLRLQGIHIINYIEQLVDSSSVASVGSAASRCRSGPHERVGVTAKHQKNILFSPLQRTTFLGMVWDSTSMQARLSPAHIESILSAVKRIRLGQSLTVIFILCKLIIWLGLTPTGTANQCCQGSGTSGYGLFWKYSRGKNYRVAVFWATFNVPRPPKVYIDKLKLQ